MNADDARWQKLINCDDYVERISITSLVNIVHLE